jgi:hypothetical protein
MNTAEGNKQSAIQTLLNHIKFGVMPNVPILTEIQNAQIEFDSLMGQVRDAEAFRLRWNERDKEIARLKNIEAAARELLNSFEQEPNGWWMHKASIPMIVRDHALDVLSAALKR